MRVFHGALRLIICAFWLAVPARVGAQGAQTQLRFNPIAGSVAVGQTLAVSLEIQNVTDLYGVDITVQFDPLVLEVLDAYPQVGGIQVAQGTFLEPGFVLVNTVDNQAGTARFAMTQLNPSPAKSGSGSLLVLTVRGRQANQASSLTFGPIQLASRAGTPIAALLVPGEVQVVSQPDSGPTHTPVPTVGPGTVFPSATAPGGPPATSVPAGATATLLPPNPTQTAAPGQSTATPPAASPTHTPAAAADTAAAPAAASPAATLPAGTPAAQAQSTAVLDLPSASPPPTATAGEAGQPEPPPTFRSAIVFPTRTEMPTPQGGFLVDPGVPSDAGEAPDAGQRAGNGVALAAGGAGLLALSLLLLSLRRRRSRL